MKATRVILLVLVALTMVGCFSFEANIPKPPPIDIRINGGDAGSDTGPAILIDVGDNASTAGTPGAEDGLLFYTFDVLTRPGERQHLLAHLENTRTRQGLAGVTITFYQLGEAIGSATTDGNGVARLPVEPKRAGDYLFTARVAAVPANVSDSALAAPPTPLLLVARDSNAKFVAVKLDRTLVRGGLSDVLAGRDASPMVDAIAVLDRLATDEGYTVVYLTARAELGTSRLKLWLQEHGFPNGPVLVMDLEAAWDPSGGDGIDLADVRKAYPDVSMTGIAGEISAARFFLDNGMTAILLPRCEADPDEMRDLADDIEDLPDSPWLSVVNSWQDAETAIIHNLHYSPDRYAERLEKLADEIEDQQNRDHRPNR